MEQLGSTAMVSLLFVATLFQSVQTFHCSDAIFTPVNWPGPPLTVSREILSKAFTCVGDLTSNTSKHPGPILFVPGTTAKGAAAQFDVAWTLELSKLNWPYCLIDPPNHGLGDMQISAEYIVFAIREMYQRTHGRRINIVGHSQGGTTPRWALRFWPDTRFMVNNLIGLAAANHDIHAPLADLPLPSIPAQWQFWKGSKFMCALNSLQETFDTGIAYTQIITRYDEAIQPINGSELNGGANIYIQDICPNNRVTHIGIGLYDQTAYLIAMDALLHQGSASLTRIKSGLCRNERCCQQLFMSSFDQATINNLMNITFVSNSYVERYPKLYDEPELKCYALRDCAMKLNSTTSSL